MNGIDISAWQAGIVPSAVDADFIIVKATEGVSYVNPHYKAWADEILASGKLLGFYHYANGGDVYAEANHFINAVKGYVGKAILVLDWESGGNERFWVHNQWTNPWLRYVQQRTGATPFLYASQSVAGLNDTGYPLWIAQYPDYNPTGYQAHPWNEGAYECAIRQYSSKGRISGFDRDIDINKAYISREQWLAYAGATEEEDDDMKPTIIGLRGEPTLYALDGGRVMKFDNEMQLDTYKAFYKERFGYDVPDFRWADRSRFEAFLRLHAE